jgi:hypothetical protein
MTPELENAELENDLDCQNFVLRNVRTIYPVPPGLVDKDDPSLYDPRVPPIASVTDESVSSAAGIQQSKLSLNGVIPTPWVGTGNKQAARGDLIERVSRKGAANGYAALDSTGKVPLSNVTTGAGVGKVTFVALQMPPELDVTGPISASSGIFTVPWKNVPDQSWFGFHGAGLDSVSSPSFKAEPIHPTFVSAIPASKFTTGQLPPALLPVAVGVGVGNASGAIPDPGAAGHPTDYLGRDMQWHTFQLNVASQPTAPTPTIELNAWSPDEVIVTVRSSLEGSSLFILVQKYPAYSESAFVLSDGEEETISVNDQDVVWAYAAKAGYNNSVFVPDSNPWMVVTPLTEVT